MTRLEKKLADLRSAGRKGLFIYITAGAPDIDTSVKAMLEAGKHVATSNKALVAEKGAELLSTARKHNAQFQFEASVGGGIPIIRTILSCLTGDEIEEVIGIINGTTNYMMTKKWEIILKILKFFKF